jgi:FAD binding domain
MHSQLTAHPSDIPLKNLYNLLEAITVPPEETRFTNWGRSFTCTPSAIFEPENEFQCELVLELARREGKTIRVAGVGHSPSDLACTSQYMLRTTKLNRILEVARIEPLSSLCGTLIYCFIRSIPRNSMSLLRGVSPSTISMLNWPRTTLR